VVYVLEVYEESAGKYSVAAYEGIIPFLPLHAGDTINPVGWEMRADKPEYAHQVLHVLRCEHLLYEAAGAMHLAHQVLVYTRAVCDSTNMRWRRPTAVGGG
jgi:hypothetical protein